jgi:hypothetical protein
LFLLLEVILYTFFFVGGNFFVSFVEGYSIYFSFVRGNFFGNFFLYFSFVRGYSIYFSFVRDNFFLCFTFVGAYSTYFSFVGDNFFGIFLYFSSVVGYFFGLFFVLFFCWRLFYSISLYVLFFSAMKTIFRNGQKLYLERDLMDKNINCRAILKIFIS